MGQRVGRERGRRVELMCPRSFVAVALAATAIFLGSCSGSKTVVPNPTPAISALFPDSATAGGPAFTLSVTSQNGLSVNTFVASSVVQWNGQPRTTTFDLGTGELSASIMASDIATQGTAAVTVVNPAPGGGTSPAVTFVIRPATNPVPSINSLAPNSAVAGGAAFQLTVNGSNFVANSVVNWNGSPRSTGFSSATQLTAQVLASDIVTAGSATVTVTNPAPGGGTSSGAAFTITAAAASNSFPMLISVSASGGTANGESSSPAMSADGRYVAFYSKATNLVAEGASGNIFVRDTCLGAADPCTPRTIAVDLAPDGSAPNGGGEPAVAISADGRFVAFASWATNLDLAYDAFFNLSKRIGAAGPSVFVRDLCLGSNAPAGCTPATSLASLDPQGRPLGGSMYPTISGDGRYIAFTSVLDASAGGATFRTLVFWRDTCAGTDPATKCTPSTSAINAASRNEGPAERGVSMSFDARFIAFVDTPSAPAGSDLVSQIRMRDTCAGSSAATAGCNGRMFEITSLASSGSAEDGTDQPSISIDGRFVAFAHAVSSPAASAEPEGVEVLIHDNCLGPTAPDTCVPSTAVIAQNDFRPLLSGSGRYVSLVSANRNLQVYDSCFGASAGCKPQIYRISSTAGAILVDQQSTQAISFEGGFIAFVSSAAISNLPASSQGNVFVAATGLPQP
jgi:hypothetical protein